MRLKWKNDNKGAIILAYSINRGINMDYSVLIKKLREKLMVSQMEMASLLGVSFTSINRWENSKTTPVYVARRKIVELCKENNIEIEE